MMQVYCDVTLRIASADVTSAQCGIVSAAWVAFFFPPPFFFLPVGMKQRLGNRYSGIGRGILIKT